MDRVLVVTGGSRGIGKAVALLAAKAGYTVCLSYVSDGAAAADVVERITREGGEAVAAKCDVGSESEIVALFQLADKTGPLAGLVNNAGVVDLPARVDEMSAARIERLFRINVGGSILCAREAVRRLSNRHGGKGGAIVNLSSAAARHGSPGEYVDYAATKGAIDTFTLGLAREVAAEGIRVNAVRPGIIDTDIHASGGQPDRAERFRAVVPMRREGTADEVASAIVWLLSDAASYVTGAILDVSGGR